MQTSIELAKSIPDNCVKVSESGINNPENIIKLKEHGFNGFLIGENFMKSANPGA
ncbi:MAG: indole-3-glycerol-phosphate synthase TrpC, partial [Chlorobi bacterium]|nr:indole-3-glycerol-phosphate synthase TrpC [Chlorobiota bacterium]